MIALCRLLSKRISCFLAALIWVQAGGCVDNAFLKRNNRVEILLCNNTSHPTSSSMESALGSECNILRVN